MSRWSIDVEDVRTVVADVVDAASESAAAVARGDDALADAARLLARVDGVGSRLAGLSAEWGGVGARANGRVTDAVDAVAANVAAYVDADGQMAETAQRQEHAADGVVTRRGFGPLSMRPV